jgi:hypothetical protein
MVIGQGAVLTPTQQAECYVTSFPWQPTLPNICFAAERLLERATGAGSGGPAPAGAAAGGGAPAAAAAAAAAPAARAARP